MHWRLFWRRWLYIGNLRQTALPPSTRLSPLNNLSNCLSGLGLREDALEAILEAVDLRQLVTDHPAAFNPVLAESLNNLSVYLSDLGHRQDGLGPFWRRWI
jgi:hypothetical protein